MRAKFGVLEQTQGVHLQAKFHLNVFLCRLLVAKNHNFSAHFDILGILYRPPFTYEGQIWCADAHY